MPRRRKARRPPSAADVLAGRAAPDLATLVTLIHRVNPTGKALDARQTAERYHLKAALQSHLIERFGDRIEVVAHGGPQTVLLRAPGLATDAAHAPLDALSETARAWCQRQLDAAWCEAPADAPALRLPEAISTDPMRVGRAALAEYDFDAAEAAFRAAHATRPGDPTPAIALLEMWIDMLAANEIAWQFFEALSTRSPEIAALGAVAAARSGREAAARDLVRPSGVRAAEAWAALAQAALERVDLAAARSALAAARQAAPQHPMLREAARLSELAARERAPAEAALQALAPNASLSELETEAQRLRAAHPDSEVARRVLADVARQRRAARAHAALAQADEAEQAGRYGAAVTWLKAARENGAVVAERLAAAEAAAAEQRRRTRLARIGAGLADDAMDAWLAWLALPPEDRAAIDTARPEAVWLSQLNPSSSGADAKAAVRAVQALAQARALLATAPRTALALVEPHRARLAPLPDAARLIALSDEAVDLDRAARQRAQLDAAAALCDSRQWVEALARLGGLGTVSDALTSAVEAVRTRAEIGVRADALEAALGPLADRCERRRLLAELVELQPEHAPRLAEADAQVAQRFGRRGYAGPFSTDARVTRCRAADAPFWLTAEGVAVVPDVLAGWLFLRWIAGDQVQRAVRWRVGAVALLDWVVEADRLRALLDDGRVLTFDATGEILLRVDPLPTPHRPTAGIIAGGFAWLLGARLDVFAIERRQPVTHHAAVDRLVRVGAQIALFGPDAPRLASADGAVIEPAPLDAIDVVQTPDGLTWINTDSAHGLSGGLAARRWQLRANLLWAGALDWSLNVPSGALLLRAHATPDVALLMPDPDGVRVVALRPDTPPDPVQHPIWPPTEAVQPWRLILGDALAERRFSLLLDASAALTRQAPDVWLATARPQHGPWADAICHHVLRTRDPATAERIAWAALRAWPQSGLIGLMVAEPAARAGRWGTVAQTLADRTPEPGLAPRFLRLLGYARLHAGAPQAALDAWQAAIAIAPTAELERLVAAVQPALTPGAIERAPSVFSACMRAFDQADAARCAGDLRGVAEALDHAFAWHFSEGQTLARLGEALLATAGEGWRKHWGLAGVAERLTRPVDPQRRIELPMAGRRWRADRMQAIAERARAALD